MSNRLHTRIFFTALCILSFIGPVFASSLSAEETLPGELDKVTRYLRDKFSAGKRPSFEKMHLGEIWICLHHYADAKKGREDNLLEIAEFRKSGEAMESEGTFYSQFLKGKSFNFASREFPHCAKDSYSSTYLSLDRETGAALFRFGEEGRFNTSYMICKLRGRKY